WILRATVDCGKFRSVVENVRLGHTGEAFIVNKEGYYQTRPKISGKAMEKVASTSLDLTPFDGVIFWEAKDERGNKVLHAKTWMKDNNWLLVVKQDVDEAFTELYATRNMALVAFSLGVLLLAAVTFLTTRLLVHKIEEADEEKGQRACHISSIPKRKWHYHIPLSSLP
ncbi:unnamed protein product, partial [marine sediment metagenome]